MPSVLKGRFIAGKRANPGTAVPAALRSLLLCVALLLLGGCSQSAGDEETGTLRQAATATPAFVQGTYAVPQAPQSLVNIPFTAAQQAGNLNVVIVGWNFTTSSVTSVTDSRGNVYQLAAPALSQGGGIVSQAIYYAKNIAAGSNTVTVQYAAAVGYPDIRVLEYSGIDPVNPLDGAVGAVGTTATSSSGPLTTTNPTDLLVGANIVQNWTFGPGTGFTQRMMTEPNGSIVEDAVVTSVGAYTATAPLAAGGWVMQLVAFRAQTTGPDTQAPAAPTNLAATPVSTSAINLAWTAATDNVAVTSYEVEACSGSGCTNFAGIGTTAGTTFAHQALAAATSYSYRVRALDAAGNIGPYSNVAMTSTLAPDTQAPTDPTSLVASPISANRVDLLWSASTDNVGVTGYRVEACAGAGCTNFLEVATPSGTSYSHTGLTAGTVYRYRVRAGDAAGNLSGYSAVASATTTSPDTQAPTAPGNATAVALSPTTAEVSWAASTDNVGVTAYQVERCAGASCTTFASIGSTAATSLPDGGLSPATTYRYRVRASDAAGNLSGYSSIASATTPPASATATPAFVQGTYAVPQSPQSLVNIPFTAAQQAGNLNVVIVGWNFTTSSVTSVTDSRGNVYQLAAPALSQGGGIVSQAIYFAKNIAVGANTVTVQFASAVSYPDIRTLEYSGIDSVNPLDGSVGAVGTTATSSSGPLTTTNPTDLLVGANIVQNWTFGPGAGFAQRIMTQPNGSIVEDAVVTSAGTYTATAPLAAGGWVMQLVAFRAASLGPDVQPPTSPTNLAASPISTSQINLSWTASTDNVGVTAYLVEACTGAACTDFTQVGTTGSTSFNHTGLAAGTAYRYRVRASDVANNLSGYSNVASATTTSPDTTPPTAPTNLAASVVSNNQVNLAWTGSTDNVGVTGYQVESCLGAGCTNYALITTTTTPSYSHTGLAAGSAHGYRVRAIDAAGNASGYSNAVSATTTAPDTDPPSAPAGLTAAAASDTAINLSWPASTDNVGVTGYQVESCAGASCTNFALLTTVGTTSYSHTGLTSATTRRYRVRATDAAGNLGGYSVIATATTTDTQAPAAPATLTATVISDTRIDLAWAAATDNVGVTGYRVEACTGVGCTTFTEIAAPTGTSFSNTGLVAGNTYRYRVRAADAAGNLGAYSPIASANTSDTQAPTIPGNLVATAISGNRIDLAWSASTDNVGVANYQLESCWGVSCTNFALTTTTPSTTFSHTGLVSAWWYRYRVRAVDVAGNTSGYSAIASAFTPDIVAPAAPTNLAATAGSNTSVNLTWTAATDNLAVTGYRVESCVGAGCTNFLEVAQPTGTSYSHTGLTAGTTYQYRVRATDAAGNLGAYSTVASATTTNPDTQAPTAPASLTAVAQSPTTANVSWAASTDNVGVTAYQLERCAGASCTNFAQVGSTAATSLPDGGLTAATTYRYRVRAADAAGNLSAYSPIATVVTPSAGDTATPAFVQGTYAVPQSPQSLVNIPFTAAQQAGNLNVVIVGWNFTTSSVTSVTDSRGNVYQLAAPALTQGGGIVSQAIYFAKSIAAGSNTVTVQFASAVSYPDIRVLEYSGIDPVNPLDGAVGAVGTTATSSSGPLTTTNAKDLLVGANIVQNWTFGPGTGFTQRMMTDPNGSIVEDAVVTSVGSYTATAPLAAGGWVMQLVAFKAASLGPDVQPPTAPTSLAATAISGSQINLSWAASTDNVAVTSYSVEACVGDTCTDFAVIGTTAGTTHNHTGLAAGTTYRYRVRAADAAGNLSGYSSIVNRATLAPDTQAPTAPTGLGVSTISANQLGLSWTASADNVGVTGYLVESCLGASCTNFAQIATPTVTSYTDSGLQAGTAYRYRVRAVDAAGNTSAYSAIAGGTTSTPDTQAPTVPSGLAATVVSSSQINLAWSASTDNVGVTAYFVERCAGTGCSNFAHVASTTGPSFSDTGVNQLTPYSYRVRATDAAGNTSGYSNVASGTTPASGATSTPAFVQGNYGVPQTAQSTVNVPFTQAQRVGDLNVIIVGWNFNVATVTSVTDSRGNIYALAAPILAQSGGIVSQAIYYAKNIAAGSNTVTVTFNTSVAYPDIRILEYSGIDIGNPLDGAVGGTGSSATASSGPLTTTQPNALLVGAAIVQNWSFGPGAGFTQRIMTQPNGSIVEDAVVTTTGTYTATAPIFTGGWVMQLVAFKAGAPDATPPTVSVTSPTSGSTLTGTVTVNVNATDAQGVVNTQLLVDGTVVGAPDTTSQYSFQLDTTGFPNGQHQIGALALDTEGNTASATQVSVTFSNTVSGNPAQDGAWSSLVTMPIVSVNQALMPNGKVLIWDGQYAGGDVRVWDLAANTFTPVPAPENLFCSGQEQLADGRIFIAGGTIGAHIGLTVANLFNPATNTWTVLADMAHPRWYPTVTALPDGRMLVQSGEDFCPNCFVSVPEIYNPSNNTWTQLNSAPFVFSYYPHVFVLPNGRVLVSSTGETPTQSQLLNLTNLTWSAVGGPAVDGGSAVMYAPNKILKTGTSVDADQIARPSAATAYVIDMAAATPTWRQVPSMHQPRTYHNMTSLPDGTVLVTGGGPTTAPTDIANGILPVELWSPTTETFTQLAPMAAPRLYHSEALLLPDGRVLISGGGRWNGLDEPTDQENAQYFSPPYLFKGTRPVITSAPTTLSYGQAFQIASPDAAGIQKVTLVRFGNVTHAFNSGQRFLSLPFTVGTNTLNVTAPASNADATPGYYMLFLVNNLGVPSVASIVRF